MLTLSNSAPGQISFLLVENLAKGLCESARIGYLSALSENKVIDQKEDERLSNEVDAYIEENYLEYLYQAKKILGLIPVN